jgi:hypothetical protein
MLLIIEIMLTVAVWKNGWRAWALAPLGITVAFLVAIAVEAPGLGSSGELRAVALLFDAAVIVALLIMRANPPKANRENRQARGAHTTTPAVHNGSI